MVKFGKTGFNKVTFTQFFTIYSKFNKKNELKRSQKNNKNWIYNKTELEVNSSP